MYAPNSRASRESFLTGLTTTYKGESQKLIVAGDFTCILDAQRDRSKRSSGERVKSESPTLEQLVRELQLQDAIDSVLLDLETDTRPPHEYFTYWRTETASRLDRFYVATTICPLIQCERVRISYRHSDHQAVVLSLKDTRNRVNKRPEKPRSMKYPLRSTRPQHMLQQVSDAIEQIETAHSG